MSRIEDKCVKHIAISNTCKKMRKMNSAKTKSEKKEGKFLKSGFRHMYVYF